MSCGCRLEAAGHQGPMFGCQSEPENIWPLGKHDMPMPVGVEPGAVGRRKAALSRCDTLAGRSTAETRFPGAIREAPFPGNRRGMGEESHSRHIG